NSNQISNSGVGILFFADGGRVEGNSIAASGSAAIEFGCFAGSARNNIISDTPVGLDQETAVFDGANSFDNTATISTIYPTPCAAAETLKGASVKAESSEASNWKWRTPASPNGALQ